MNTGCWQYFAGLGRYVALQRVSRVLLAVAIALGFATGVRAQAPAAKPAPEEPKFEIRRFTFDGSKLIPPGQLAGETAQFVGKDRTFADVQRALETIERIYSRLGYSAVQVVLPEQELEKGEIRFQIIEAKLGRVIVEGSKFFDEANIRASLPSLAPGEAPNIHQIARDLRIANESPAKQTTVLLRSGQEEATVDAVARVVDEKPQKGSITVDSSGSQKTGRLRVGFGYQNAQLAGTDSVLTLQFVTAPYQDERKDLDKNRFSLLPSKDVQIIGVGLHIPLYALGDSIDLTMAHSSVSTGTISGFSITGQGSIFSARYNWNLPRIDDYEHRISFSLDTRLYQNKGVRAEGSNNQIVPDVDVHPVGVLYAGSFRRQDSETSASLGVYHNMSSPKDGGGVPFCATRQVTIAGSGHFECAKPRFTIWRWSVSHNHALPDDWQVRFGLNGQITRDMLIPGEQFGIGGVDSVRGFLEREVVNDLGYRGTFELYSPDWGGWTGISGARARAVVFYDWGNVRRIRPSASEAHGSTIGGIGAGLRFSLGNSFVFRTDVGRVVDRGGGGGTVPPQSRGDTRLTFSMSYVY